MTDLFARAKHVTASRMDDLTARTKSGPSASRQNYLAEKIQEHLTNLPYDNGYQSPAMRIGIEREPIARNHYIMQTGFQVEESSFCKHPRIVWSGASPDGLVEKIGLVEIKCPNLATHLDTWLFRKIPEKYVKQMQWQMACCPERHWCDYVSFYPDLEADMQLMTIRVFRDNGMIQNLETQVEDFVRELMTRLGNIETERKRRNQEAK